MRNSFLLSFIFIINTIFSYNLCAQKHLNLDAKELGTKIHVAPKSISLKSGYHYKAVDNNFMHAYIDEDFSIPLIDEMEALASTSTFIEGECSLLDLIELANLSYLPGNTSLHSISEALLENYSYGQLTSMDLETFISAAEEVTQVDLSDLQKTVVNLESKSLIQDEKYVGSLSGKANVSNSGSFSYSLPINLPPGGGDLAPNLNIGYSSGSGNGVMGYGWSMTGLSAITSTGYNWHLDGKVDALRNDDRKLMLGGTRLKSLGAVNGNGEEFFLLESDPYTKITSYDEPNDGIAGPSKFKVIRKDGTTTWYGLNSLYNGSSSNSRLTTNNDGTDVVLIWLIDKVEDCNGNFMEFKYNTHYNPLGSGVAEPRIDEIRYSGNTTKNQAPYNKIKFNYVGNRPDSNKTFIGGKEGVDGLEVNLNYLLQNIVVHTKTFDADEEDTWLKVSQYDFSYCTGWDDAVNYSFLRMIEMSGTTVSEKLNPTIFNYGIHKRHNPFTNQKVSAVHIQNEQRINQTYEISVDNEVVCDLYGGNDSGFPIVVTGDFNGDGKQDIVAQLGNSDNNVSFYKMYFASEEGTGFIAAPIEPIKLQISSEQEKYVLRVADFDSNGLDDILVYKSKYKYLESPYQCTPTMVRGIYGFYDFEVLYSSFTNDIYQSSVVSYPDLDYIINAHEAVTDPNYSDELVNGNNLLIGDFNGDSFPDIIHTKTIYPDSLLDCLINNSSPCGGGFDHEREVKTFISSPFLGKNNIEIPNTYLKGRNIYLAKLATTTDINGDGKNELFLVRNENYDKHDWSILDNTTGCNVANHFINTQNNNTEIFEIDLDLGVNSATANRIYQSDYPKQDFNIYIGDFNGDRKTDLLTRLSGDNTWKVAYSTGFTFRVLSLNQPLFSPSFNSFHHDLLENGARIFINDFNGDGKSDIGWYTDVSANGYQSIPKSSFQESTEYNNPIESIPTINTGISKMFIVFYSYGDGFKGRNLLKQDENFYPDFMIPGDFNGDGKTDILFNSPIDNGSVLSNLLLNIKSESLKLKDTRDGFGNFTHTEYQSIAYPNNGIYTKSSGSTFPLNDVQYAMQVAEKLSVTDGVGGENVTRYKYEGLKSHRQGRGSMGFAKFISENQVFNTIKESNYGIDNQYYVPYPISNEIKDLNNNPIVTKTFSGNFIPSGLVSIYDYRLANIVETSHLRNQTLTTNFTYDYNGNLYKKEIITPETRNEQIYEDYVGSSCYPYPYLPQKTITTSERLKNGVITDSNTYESDFIYNNKGNLVTSILNSNKPYPLTTNYSSHDDYGNVQGISISYYDESGVLKTRTRVLGYEEGGRWFHSDYYSLNQVTYEATEYDYDERWGTPTLITDLGNSIPHTKTFEYDAFGMLESEFDFITNSNIQYSKEWDVSSGSNANSIYREIMEEGNAPDEWVYYDSFGREVKSEYEGYHENIRTITSYDERGNIDFTSEPYYVNLTPFGQVDLINYTYDEYNRLQNVNSPTGNLNYIYGNSILGYSITEQEVELGRNTYSVFKDFSDLPTYIIKEGTYLDYEYNHNGDLKKVRMGEADVGGNVDWSSLEEVSIMNYDTYGRRTELIDKNAGLTSYTYNGADELVKEVDGKGNELTLTYDELGRILTKTNPEGTKTYTYVPQGSNGGNLPDKITNYNGVEVDYDYDQYGRLWKEKIKIDNTNFSKIYSYKPLSHQLEQVQYSSGFKKRFEYNNKGYLNKITNGNGSVEIFQPDTTNPNSIYIDEKNRFRNYLLGNNISSEIEYDEYDYPLSYKANGVQDLEFGFNQFSGNLEYRKDYIKSKIETFSYDIDGKKHDRLSSATVTDLTGQVAGQSLNLEYSANGNISHKSDVGDYIYDTNNIHAVTKVNNPLVNNIPTFQQDINFTSFQQPLNISENNKSIDFTYGLDNNRIKTVYKEGNKVKEVKYFLGDFEYVINKKECVVAYPHPPLVIGIKGKVAQADLPSDEVDTNLNEIGTNKDTKYTLEDIKDIKDVAIPFSHNCDEKTFVHYIGADGLNAIVTKKGNTTDYHYTYTDHLGSILTVTDNNGVVEAEKNYDAWGKERNPDTWDDTPTTSKPNWLYRGYTGHEELKNFSLINMNGRLYDPLLARMLSPDKFVPSQFNSQHYNRYSYVFNNPLKYNDPSGECPECPAPATLGLTAGDSYLSPYDGYYYGVTASLEWTDGTMAAPYTSGTSNNNNLNPLHNLIAMNYSFGGSVGNLSGSGNSSNYGGNSGVGSLSGGGNGTGAATGMKATHSTFNLGNKRGFLKTLQNGLDLLSVLPIPALSNTASIISGGISIYHGEYTEGLMNIASALSGIPGSGNVKVGYKLGMAMSSKKTQSLITTLRSGKDIYVKNIDEARGLIKSMPDLKPFTDKFKGFKNTDLAKFGTKKARDQYRFGGLWKQPRGTFDGHLLNTKNPTSSLIHKGNNQAHNTHAHYNLRFFNSKKAAIMINNN